jgi:hypothetical protein
VINGAEHYLHAFRYFSCYGQPIRNPLTRRVEGVLDITTVGPESNPLFRPLISRAAQDIEDRILDAARVGNRRLLTAFEQAARHRSSPVAVLDADTVLMNRSGADLLGSTGTEQLRTLLPRVCARGSVVTSVDLEPVGRVEVNAIDAIRDQRRPDGTWCSAKHRNLLLYQLAEVVDHGRAAGLMTDVPDTFRPAHRQIRLREEPNEDEPAGDAWGPSTGQRGGTRQLWERRLPRRPHPRGQPQGRPDPGQGVGVEPAVQLCGGAGLVQDGLVHHRKVARVVQVVAGVGRPVQRTLQPDHALGSAAKLRQADRYDVPPLVLVAGSLRRGRTVGPVHDLSHLHETPVTPAATKAPPRTMDRAAPIWPTGEVSCRTAYGRPDCLEHGRRLPAARPAPTYQADPKQVIAEARSSAIMYETECLRPDSTIAHMPFNCANSSSWHRETGPGLRCSAPSGAFGREGGCPAILAT